jgi:hypothetical protein
MRLASSKPSSLSLSLAALLIGSTGLDKQFPKSTGVNTKNRKLVAKYQSEIRSHAKTQKGWSDIADSIKVSILNNNSVKVSIEGSKEVKEKAKMLEYGTGETSPNALIRTFETKFNDDVKRSLKGYA